MRMQRIILGVALSTTGAVAAQGPAHSEEYQGTWAQRMACTPDVMRLCSDQIPDANRIVACLRQNTPQLGSACRAVFESNASAQPKSPPPGVQQQGVPRARAPQPQTQPPSAQPNPYRPYGADE
jgi:hypothetical protein